MKIFLDTNVLVAAYATHGSCNELLSHCFACHTVFISDFVLDEVADKLLRKIKLTAEETDRIMLFLRQNCTVTAEMKPLRHVSRDHDDDHILAAALYGNVDCIITGDKDLLILEKIETIPILAPAAYWKFQEK